MKKTSKQFKRILALIMAVLMLTGVVMIAGTVASAADNDGIVLHMRQVSEAAYKDEYKDGLVVVGFEFTGTASNSIATSISIPATSRLNGDTTNTSLPVYGLEARAAQDDVVMFSLVDNTIDGKVSKAATWVKYLTLPNSIKFIGKNALAGCTGLAKITFDGTCKQWSEIDIDPSNDAILENVTFSFKESKNPDDHGGDTITKMDDTKETHKCTKCGAEFTVAHNFQLQDGSDPATCGEEGHNYYKCQNKNCGYEKVEVLYPTGNHRPSDEYVQVDKDEHKYKCAVCGEMVSDKHSWSSKITSFPTCTQTGVKTYECTKCKFTYTEPVKALGHALTPWEYDKNATLFQAGTESRYCTYRDANTGNLCGYTETRYTLEDTESIKANPNADPFNKELLHPCYLVQGFNWIAGKFMFLGHTMWQPIRLVIEWFWDLDQYWPR